MEIDFQKLTPRGFLRKTCSENTQQITGEHPWRSVISIKLLCIFIEITRQHGCSRVNLLHIFRTPFPKNTSGGLLLEFECRTPYTGSLSDKYLQTYGYNREIS